MNCKKYYKLFAITAILLLIVVFSVLIYRKNSTVENFTDINFGDESRKLYATNNSKNYFIKFVNDEFKFTENEDEATEFEFEVNTGSTTCQQCTGQIDCSENVYFIYMGSGNNKQYLEVDSGSFDAIQSPQAPIGTCSSMFKISYDTASEIYNIDNLSNGFLYI